MKSEISTQSVFMGFLAAFVGFASSFAVVLQGLKAVGASETQAASGLMATAIAMGVGSVIFGLWTRHPAAVAWSTPGAALLVNTGIPEGGFQVAVGAFFVCAALVILTALVKPIGQAIGAIPMPLANAMLAGVLLGLCLAPVKAVAFDPWLGLPIVLAWLVVGRLNRLLAVPAALMAFILVILFGVKLPSDAAATLSAALIPQFEWVVPEFTMPGLVGIALPLYLVTMASQNIPGIAVLRANGYTPKPGPLFAGTGILSLFCVPFGGHAVNMSAIVASMCAGPDSHADPKRRYWAAISFGVGSIALGLLAGFATTFISLAPSILIEAVAGLALIAAFSASLVGAFQDEKSRQAAAVTFLTTASGLAFFDISSAFWGLLAGGLVYIFTAKP